jgi:hypothetical protein
MSLDIGPRKYPQLYGYQQPSITPLRKTRSLPDDADVPIHDSLVVEF